MNVLPLAVKYHHSCKAEVACYYQIIVSGCCACILQKPFDRVGSGRGKCQENTINFLKFIFSFVYAVSETLFMGAAVGR